jgi:hypothetical protein
MHDVPAPSGEVMTHIYRAVADMLQRRGMSHADSKAGCARCGACSGLPTFAAAASGNGRELAVIQLTGAAGASGTPSPEWAPGRG